MLMFVVPTRDVLRFKNWKNFVDNRQAPLLKFVPILRNFKVNFLKSFNFLLKFNCFSSIT